MALPFGSEFTGRCQSFEKRGRFRLCIFTENENISLTNQRPQLLVSVHLRVIHSTAQDATIGEKENRKTKDVRTRRQSVNGWKVGQWKNGTKYSNGGRGGGGECHHHSDRMPFIITFLFERGLYSSAFCCAFWPPCGAAIWRHTVSTSSSPSPPFSDRFVSRENGLFSTPFIGPTVSPILLSIHFNYNSFFKNI